VAFYDNNRVITGCEAKTPAGGVATCSVSTLAIGSHPVAAYYSGSSGSGGTSNTVTQTVRALTSTILFGQPSSREGEVIDFAAVVSPSAAGGTVTFMDNGVNISGCVNINLFQGTAACLTFTPWRGAPIP